MDNHFMGAELAARELTLGSPVPAHLPEEGVIVPRVESDGWTRKYLHQMGMNPICISEIPPRRDQAPALSGSEIRQVDYVPQPPPLAPDYSVPPPPPAPYEMGELPVSKRIPVSTPVR